MSITPINFDQFWADKITPPVDVWADIKEKDD